eukprot:g903.t1
MVDRLNRSRRDKLDWAAKLGLGPLSRGEAPPGLTGEVPRNAREVQAQKKQAEEMAELRRRIDQKQADVVATPPAKPEEEDASGFLNPNAKTNAKKKATPKSVLELRMHTKPTVVDVEEDYSDASLDRRRRKRRGRVAYDDEDSEQRHFRNLIPIPRYFADPRRHAWSLRQCYDVVRHNFGASDQDLDRLYRLLSCREEGGQVHVMAHELRRAQLLPHEAIAQFAKERHPKEVFFDYEDFKSIVWPKLKERWVSSETIRKQKTLAEEKHPLQVRIRQNDSDHAG